MSRLNLVPYVGGKSFLLKHLLPLIPDHKIYVEVFGGGAVLLLNKLISEVEVYNDVDSELVNLFMTIRSDPAEFRRQLEGLPYSRELFYRWVKQLKVNGWPQDPVERALRFYYIASCSMMGRVGRSWAFGRVKRSIRRTMVSRDFEAIHRRLIDVIVDHLDFRSCIRNWDSPETFFYLDPPYYGPASLAYRHAFTEKDHEELAEILKKSCGQWLLTYGDHVRIRELYRGFNIRKIFATLASVKTSRRDAEAKHRKTAHLLITNYSPSPFKKPLKEFKHLLLFSNFKISAKECKRRL